MRLPLLAGLLLLGGGCHHDNTWFEDDVDFDFDFIADAIVLSVGATPDDDLKTPYVEGAQMTLWALNRKQNDRFADWTLESADPDIFTVDGLTFLGDDAGGSLQVEGYAASEGQTDLELLDEDGDVRDTTPIEVMRPDRVELHAAGPMYVQHPAVPTLADDPQILAGHTATFQVQYYAGGTLLSGNGVLGVQPDGQTEASIEQSWFFEDREWVHLTPATEGTHQIGISVNGLPVETVPIEAVPESAVDRIEVYGRSDSGAEDGEWLVLLAQAYDATDVPIYGVEYTWDIDGVDEEGMGDLYRYEYLASAHNTVGANFGELRAETTIHAGDGFVDSSNNVGCNSTGGVPAGFGVLAGLGGLGLRRRRA
jgi:MYXO-CTERM domain-containing protein